MGGKSSAPTIGYWYHVAYHHGLTTGPIDAFLEFRGGDKTAWQGELTASGTISVNAPELWGGETDQGGIVGDMDIMFGEPAQAVNSYLVSTFGSQVPAWRGMSTVVFKGGKYGAMNPYPQKASYKIRRIVAGWDDDACWYPTTAPIGYGAGGVVAYTSVWKYRVEEPGSTADYSSMTYGDADWATGPGGFGSEGSASAAGQGVGTAIEPLAGRSIWLRGAVFAATGATIQVKVWHDDGATLWWNETPYILGAGVQPKVIDIPPSIVSGFNRIALKVTDSVPYGDPSAIYASLEISGAAAGALAMNPAHVLYDSRTNSDMGRESTANINEASLQAAADTLFAEGFGICPKWDPASESVEEFEQRICKLIGGSFNRSLEDGQWYLDLARGDYVIDDLPILTDDDILDFKEQPSTLDSAINSVSVRYFDTEKKETIVTPPVRALGLVSAFGTIHQTYDCPEIPTGTLATRVAQMKLMATATPTRVYELVTTRRTYAWRPNQYFRLQSVKRGIVDMVCIVGDKQSGTLKSGAIRMKATQDIYGLPATSFVEVEPGVDTRPPQTPSAITLQAAFEAPYIEVCTAMSRADLAALPDDVGFAMAVAAAPAGELDYTMMVAPSGGSYASAGRGQWCATATVIESTITKSDTAFTLANGVRLDQVTTGMAVLWDDEICRVDAIDAGAGTITLGRGCADTVPSSAHAGGSRLWFYEAGAAYDTTEYTDAETVDLKLLTNTGSQRLAEADATAMSLTFNQRQFRPYPPAGLTINAAAYPAAQYGAITAAWVHRDRVLQADQLLASDDASVGPEEGTTYTVRWYSPADTLVAAESGITGAASTPYVPPVTPAVVKVEVEAVRDGVTSWHVASHAFDWATAASAVRITEAGDRRITEAGDVRMTE